MWSRARRGCGGWRVLQARRMISSRPPPVSVSSAVNSMLLRSLRDHYLEVSKMTPPPKVSKPGQKDSLHFLCGLYPDALGIHSVSMRPKLQSSGFLVLPSQYNGPVFQDLNERMRDALHSYIEERGVNESLFPFLQAWLYVKDHRNLMHWFQRVGTFINEQKPSKDASSSM
ncbi:mitochondrial acidic protein MAM33 isoform X2 [Vitis riparia]|uniref:mitochondrial acidic protein MAM33 isoform X2 n=1 Tax=Vitis riparia TaxID=96939 RepID=UPI00155B3ACA|nr:mitochondrial acidic protein MAM33 isoform X2 [Vitis riparia]